MESFYKSNRKNGNNDASIISISLNSNTMHNNSGGNYEKEDSSKVFKLDVVAEKVTFLSSRSKDTPERE